MSKFTPSNVRRRGIEAHIRILMDLGARS